MGRCGVMSLTEDLNDMPHARLLSRLTLGLAVLSAGCGHLDPADFREMVIGQDGGTLRIPGTELMIPTTGGPRGGEGERTFSLFHPPSVPPAPSGETRAAVGIGPPDFIFPEAAVVTTRSEPAAGSVAALRLFLLDTETDSYKAIPEPALELTDEGRSVRFPVDQGGVYVLTEDVQS